jgi:hypothetical protein
MFEAITIKSKETSGLKIDIGFLAECLLFYRSVNLLSDKNTLPELLELCGIDKVRELIKRGRLNLFIREDILGTSAFPNNGGELYDLQTWSSEAITQEKILNESFIKLTGSPDQSKVLTKEFLDLTKPFKYNIRILEEIKEDLNDKTYLAKAIASTIKFWNPDNSPTFNDIKAAYYQTGEFGPFKTHKFETNIDLSKYQNVSASGIILNIAEARGDIHIASHFNSEIADKPIYSSLIQDRFNSIFDKFEISEKGIAGFQEVILPDYKPISATLRNKEKPFKDFIEILDKADKFRGWLDKVGDDKNIIAEYHKAVTTETWADKLPTKGVRFAFFTTAGIVLDALITGGIGTIAGVALGAGDTFVIDKLIKGWKPNQFIDDELKEFLPEKEKEKKAE